MAVYSDKAAYTTGVALPVDDWHSSTVDQASLILFLPPILAIAS